MRFFSLILLVFFVLAVPQAKACLGADLENTLFFDKEFFAKKAAPRDASVIVNVVLRAVHDGHATAEIVDVVKAPQGSLKIGDSVELEYEFTSCGPNESAGNQGTILARRVVKSGGKTVLYPYERRYDDGRIDPPLK